MTEQFRHIDTSTNTEPINQPIPHHKTGRPPLPLETRFRIKTLFEAGTHPAEIAEIAKISVSAAYYYRRKFEEKKDIIQPQVTAKEKITKTILESASTPAFSEITISKLAKDAHVTYQRALQIVQGIENEKTFKVKRLANQFSSRHSLEENEKAREDVIILYVGNATLEEIMSQTGRSENFVLRIISKINEAKREATRHKRDQEIADLRNKEGLGNEAIAYQLEIPKSQVTAVIKKQVMQGGAERLRNKRRSPEKMLIHEGDVSRLKADGLMNKEIAERLKTPDQSLKKSRFLVENALARIRERRKQENVVFDAQNQAPPLDA